MMYDEFQDIAGYEVSYEDYTNIIEPMYMALPNVSKQDFVKMIDRRRFALPTKAQILNQMRKQARDIFLGCGKRTFFDEELELERTAKAYAKRFYGLDWNNDSESYVFFNRKYAYGGFLTERGCSFPQELVIGRAGVEYEWITLVKVQG